MTKLLRIKWDYLSEIWPIPILCNEAEKDDNIWEYELPEDQVDAIEQCIKEFYIVYHKLTQLTDTCGINIKRDVLDKSREAIENVKTD